MWVLSGEEVTRQGRPAGCLMDCRSPLGFAGDWEILLEIKRWENLATGSEPGDDVVAHLFAMHCATFVVCVFCVLPV